MREVLVAAGLTASMLALSACGGGGKAGVFGHGKGPDEFAVSRQQPLVIPPDFALTPPKPGAPRPQEADSSALALQAMFGGPAVRSGGETGVITQAGGARSAAGVRSDVADADTTVVDKGATTREIIAAPSGNGAAATVNPPPQ